MIVLLDVVWSLDPVAGLASTLLGEQSVCHAADREQPEFIDENTRVAAARSIN
jgi:hypothetical protein